MITLGEYGSILDIGLDISWDAVSFAQQVSRRAALLSKMNIGRGSLVGILHNGSAHFFADLFATWMVGATAACLDSLLTDAELEIITGFAKPAVLLVNRTTRTVNLSTPVAELETAPAGDLSATSAFYPDDPALILFTSGTTGNPKGVVLTFRALLARISANVGVIGRTALTRTLVALPTHFGHGLIGNSLTPFLNGGEIVLHPLGASLASNLGRIIDDYRISFMSSVPALWHLAKSHSCPPMRRSLSRVHVGSAPLSAQLWSDIAKWSAAEVVNCYGLTETANWIAGASSKVDGIADGLMGRSWGSTIAVMDNDGCIQSTGQGDIVVQTSGLMTGYLNRPDLTAAAIRDGWFHTGDRGSVDERSRIWLTGRIKDEINRGGMKIQPAEIDVLLERHPAIAEACTFGIADPVSGQAVATLVRLEKGVTASPESLRAWCRERLRPSAIPERWIVVDKIPRTARGKVNRDEVRRMYADDSLVLASKNDDKVVNSLSESAFHVIGHGISSSASAQSETCRLTIGNVRRVVKRAWIEILGIPTFAANRPWSEAGGDSLDLLRLWFRIENTLGRCLSMEAMHQNITPEEIIEVVERLLDLSSEKSAANMAPERTPLVFFMPPADGDLPQHARFRAALGDKIRFVVIRYPTWPEMLAAGGVFDAIISAAVSQVNAHQEIGPCFLVGYSFGGFVAWETACRLIQSGRHVAFVGLIDTRRAWDRPSIDRPEQQQFHRGTLVRIGRFFKAALLRPKDTITIRWFLPPLVERRAFWLLRPIGRLAAKLRSRVAFEFQFRLAYELRQDSLRKWELSAAPIPITLFRSREFNSNLPDYGWGTKAAQVTVIPMGGSHLALPETEELCQRFLEAISEALDTAVSSKLGSDLVGQSYADI
jgi:acyl-CoA synthetase (AMP-forming)/AMP-acid ligase II/thioesterase domain-containing protein/acyl carrier protein